MNYAQPETASCSSTSKNLPEKISLSDPAIHHFLSQVKNGLVSKWSWAALANDMNLTPNILSKFILAVVEEAWGPVPNRLYCDQ
jgi:hypothetical protein